MATLQISPERPVDRNATTLQMRVPVFPRKQPHWWMAGPASDALRLVFIGGFVFVVGLFAYFMPPVAGSSDTLPVPPAQTQAP